MNQLLNIYVDINILISHQFYFTNTPAVTERSNRGDTGFSSKAGRRCVFPLASSHLPSCSSSPSAVLIQQLIINSYFQAVHFRNPGYGSAPQTIMMAHVRHIRHGGQEGTCSTSSWGAGISEAGLAAEPGCSAMTQVSLHAAWSHPVSCMWMSVCAFLRSWVHNEFLRLFMA